LGRVLSPGSYPETFHFSSIVAVCKRDSSYQPHDKNKRMGERQ
jgi:hypothetical protein